MSVQTYYESIKNNKAKLRQFMADMPKGAELHHHLTGAAYAETLFKIACKANLYADLDTGKLYKSDPKSGNTVELDENMKNLHDTRMTLIDKWSIRDFQPYKYPLGPDEYFFSLFSKFIEAAGNQYLPDIVHELKVRAKEENLQYIESIGIAPSVNENAYLMTNEYEEYSQKLKEYCLHFNDNPDAYATQIFDLVIKIIQIYDEQYDQKNNDIFKDVHIYAQANGDILKGTTQRKYDFITSRFDTSAVSDSDVMIKLQGYASRNSEPLIVLAQLYVVLKAMSIGCKEIVGCNLVAAENGENSMQYYKAHMIMIYALQKIFNKAKIALHAGELTMGLIPPEHLTYHITDAVKIAKAQRIGHGVDIVFEHNSDQLLQEMKANNIAIEINLTSNEFILGVKGDSHPFDIYRNSGVPMVISTDDPGILRTSITEEFTLAAYRYHLTYDEIRRLVSNSIEYSFLEEEDKTTVRNAYKEKLKIFEAKYGN